MLFVVGGIAIFMLLVPLLWAQRPATTTTRGHLTAEAVSRQFLSLHPKPRDGAEKNIIAVMEDMCANQYRGMGNIG